MPDPVIDLHVHSSASDGTAGLADLVAVIDERPVRLLAVTDHLALAMSAALAAARPGRAVVGVEIAGRAGPRLLDILAPGIRDAGVIERAIDAAAVDAAESELLGRRLRALGFEDDLDLAAGVSGQAKVRHEAALRASPRDRARAAALGAGDGPVIGKGRLVDLSADPLALGIHPELGAVVALAAEAGACPVLAHPALVPGMIDEPGLEPLLRRLRAAGLEGIEADHPAHGPATVVRLRSLAGRLGLLASVGSDCHDGTGRVGRPVLPVDPDLAGRWIERLAPPS